tara:strand:- start:3281 stop:3721 length:441 start_codon:yes stop_codon:yes gene_type:complete
MPVTINKFLKNKGYCSVNLIFLKTKHYLIKAKVNGINGEFILDSGASNSCVCNTKENKFKLETKKSKISASSATSEMLNTNISKKNFVVISKWEGLIDLVTFDMSHINNAFNKKEIQSVDGIIGADVLKKSKAILDYKSNKLYLKL